MKCGPSSCPVLGSFHLCQSCKDPGRGLVSAEIATVAERDTGFPLPHGRGDEFHHGSPGIGPRSLPPKGPKPRDIYEPDLHIDSIKVKTRNFK